ncbi:hypothetical protein AADW59_00350 [Candidatus Hodgkinia cicadicola]
MRVFFIGHGSASVGSISEFVYVVDLFRIRHNWVEVCYWILEFSGLPLITCFGTYAGICVMVPIMLFSSKHVKRDLCIVCGFLQRLNKLAVILLINDMCLELITLKLVEGLFKPLIISGRFELSRNLVGLIVCLVFRGSSDFNSNALAFFLSRALWEGIGCAQCVVCFFGLTFPLVDAGHSVLGRCCSVVFLPMLLFYGDLYFSLRSRKFVAGYIFGSFVAVSSLFKLVKRVLYEPSVGGCALCKYRVLD